MITTRELIEVLRRANPGSRIDENRVRAALRWGGVPAPSLFAGRLAWTALEARTLADHLGLRLPSELEGLTPLTTETRDGVAGGEA